jgi:VWFA-related protein
MSFAPLKTRTVAFLAFLAWVALAPGAVVLSQDHATRHGIFIDTIDVNLVNIEVMVVDKNGQPVSGLTRDDFVLRVDGDPVDITNFFAVEDGKRVVPEDEAAAAGGDTAADGEESPNAAPAALTGPEDHRFVVVFVDNGSISPPHRKRVFDELRKHLDHLMEPADRVMVVAQDGDLRIEQPFTSDPQAVTAAIERMSKVTGRGALRFMEPHLIQRDIEAGEAPPGADVLAVGTTPSPGGPLGQSTYPIDARRTLSRVSGYAQSGLAEGHRTLKVLKRFVDSLAGLPGRKAIVYVSDGLELTPGEYLFRIWDYKYGSIANQVVGIANIDTEIDRYRLDDSFNDLIARASANRVAFYTVEGGSERGVGDVSAETPVAVIDTLARTADSDREESLRALAYETGGVPLLNSSGVKGLLAQLDRDFSNYYSLGYPSPHQGDGKYHRVQVEVQREGLRARFLEGYRDKDSDDRMTDETLATLLHDVGENPLGIQVEVGKEAPLRGGKGYVVPLMVKIPMSKLVLIPQDNAHLGRLSIFLAVADSRGRISDPQKIDVPVRVPDEQLLDAIGQMAGYAAQLQMRPGEQRLAVGVRDELAAVDSTLKLDIQVGGS